MKDKENKKQKNKQKKTKKKMKLWKKILLVILMALLVAIGWFLYKTHKNGGGLSGMLATVVGHDENTKKNLPEIKVLLIGVSGNLSDSIMVASYNPKTQKATLLSIPRDTFTGTNTKRATANNKINSIYGATQDPQKVLDKVNEITNLNIKYYLVIETEALRKVVDSVGGVKFDVPIDMDYDDTSQNLAIHIKKGEQILNGEQAEGVVRFRHNNNYTTYSAEYGDNDLGRMKTQREFIKAVIEQTLKIENIFKIGQWVDILEQNVKSNLDFNTVKDYIPYAVEFKTEDLLAAALPGTTPDLKDTNNVSIFVVDKKETQKLLEELFYNRDITEDAGDGENASENTTTSTSTTSENSNISIELLNGTGNAKTLENVEATLKKLGYNVTKAGTTNATKKTTIINKKDVKQSQLERLQSQLGAGTISNSKSSSSKVDVTIIIGSDYE